MKLQIEGSGRKRGAAMIAAVIAAFIAATTIAVAMRIAHVSMDEANTKITSLQAQYLAEGAIEAAKKEIQEAIANWEDPPEAGSTEIHGEVVDYTVALATPTRIVTDAAGIQTIITGYEVEARVRTDRASAVARRLINAEATPIFQFAVFYSDDLEVNPGPNMTLSGRVHANGDAYLGCGKTLSLDTNYLRTVGTLNRHRKDNSDKSTGTVLIRRYVENPYDPAEPREFEKLYSKSQLSSLGVPSDSGYDSSFTAGFDANGNGSLLDAVDWLPWGSGSLESYSEPDFYAGTPGSTVHTAAHGVTEAVTPRIGSIAAFEERSAGGEYLFDEVTKQYALAPAGSGTHTRGYFNEEASLKILLKEDGTIEARNANDVDISVAVAGAIQVGDLFDARLSEGAPDRIPVIEIDVAALTATGHFPDNGLLFAGPELPKEGDSGAGVLLKNGAELPRGFTVVTQQSLYVQGDYNVVQKKGAAVIADAVNLLSNAWDNSKNKGSLPAASNTTFNLALITGNHETIGSKYNGGLENLPRFHEKWSGKTCSITGSFVNTWFSEYATGPWKYGSDRYTAPNRAWGYDSDFNQVVNLPPYTPMAVSARDIVSW